MKAVEGSLLFIQDKYTTAKRRPFICIHVFRNRAGVAYNWLIVPITSTHTVGESNLIEVKHERLKIPSYAKISNIESISWREEIQVVECFSTHYIRDVQEKLRNIFN